MKLAPENNFTLYISLFLLLGFFNSFAEKTNPLTSAFIENKGQILNQNYETNPHVLFLYSGKGLKVQLRKTGYSYEVFKADDLPIINSAKKIAATAKQFSKTSISSHRVDLEFINSNQNVEVLKEGQNNGVLNYFVSGKEVSGINSYNKITYKNIYNNIDIEFVLTENGSSALKYNIILNPGANIKDVKFLCKGASFIKQNTEGSLNISTSLGDIIETIPLSYYTTSPTQNVKVDFRLNNNIISFSANYDNSKTFVIDPSTNRIWGTYFGGTATEYCTSNGIDASNNVYIAGYSLSTSNIATSGVYQSTLTGSFDAYLSKFNSNGVQQWGTYFGGPSFDTFYAMHVTPSGIVYAAGDTGSTVAVASGTAHQTTYGGGIDDAILVKFDASGQRLWSTYNGGTMHDISQAVTVDGNGDVIISGHTESTAGISTSGVYATAYSLNYDVFITKFNTNGVRQWGTYYGDTGTDEAYGLTCDNANNIYVTGMTNSLFGISSGSVFQTNNGGLTDAFIAKFDPTGVNLIWATYYGGAGDDKGTAIKTDPVTGNIYLGGNTTSSSAIATPGGHQFFIGSADDGFLAAFNSSGGRVWGTYYGGNDVDYVNALILDANNNIFICGQTLSTNAISSSGAYQPNLSLINFYDAYFAKFTSAGKRKLGTYFGGPDNDNATGIAIDNQNKIYLGGETVSTVSISTVGSHMSGLAGAMDAFLVKFCIAPDVTITPMGTSTTCTNTTFTLTASGGFPTYLWSTGSSLNPVTVNSGSVVTTNYYFVTATDADGCDGISDSTKVIVSLCLGINELEGNSSINVFPVPASDIIMVKLNTKTSNSNVIIEIYSSLGELVLKNESHDKNNLIDVKNISSGIYFLKCKTPEGMFEKKIIIQ